ncbi:MAG: potassium transporter TrkG, partial [Candidatus Nanopelagicales bacterium]
RRYLARGSSAVSATRRLAAFGARVKAVKRRAEHRARVSHPSRVIVHGFASAIAVGTGLLMLPWSRASGESAPFEDALFTATSAVCVTGLATVDTGTYWSAFGQAVILLLIQIGGLGIMTMATLIVVLLSRRLGLRTRLVAQAETKSLTGADVRRVVKSVVLFSLGTEAVIAAILAARFWAVYGFDFGSSVYQGVFHAISAFNNAGFSTNPDSLTRYSADPWILITVAIAVIVGGIGFPVVFELARSWRTPRVWSVLTRITVVVTAALLAIGTLVYLLAESGNPLTLGSLSDPNKLLNAFFSGVMPRSGGFNSINIAELETETLFATDLLMFIGGGSAGTAGGIKVTTFGLLAFVIWAQMRGEPRVQIGRRQVPADNERQAVAVALMALGIVVVGAFTLMWVSAFSSDAILFESISAFATVGLSTGITPELSDVSKYILVVLMFVGRLGPLTFATALAFRERRKRYQVPEERTIIG